MKSGSRSPIRDRPTLAGDALGRAALVIIAVVTVVGVVRAFGPLTYPGDLWRQSDTATVARNFAENGLQLFYPQINWGGAGPGYVETELPLMPWGAAALYQVFGENPAWGRLISLAFMLIATGAFWGLARRLLPSSAARFALIAFAVSPAFTRWGTAFMPEATALAFYVLALLAFKRWLDDDRTAWLVAAGASVAMAGLTKPTSLHVGLVMLIWLVVSARDRLRRPSAYAVAVAALIPPGLWLWHASSLYAVYGNTFGVLSGGDSKFGDISYWTSLTFYAGNLRTEAIFIYGGVALPFALAGVWRAWRSRGPAILLAGFIALLVYYAAVARYSQSDAGIQYHIFSLPYAALATGIGLAGASEWLRDRVSRGVRRVVLATVVMLLFAESVNVVVGSLRSDGGVYQVCADALDQVSQPADLVVVSSTDPALDAGVPNNWQDPIIFYMADRRGWSLAADQHLPSFLADYQQSGAKYFVLSEPSLVPARGPLSEWLAVNATRLRSGAADGCVIWLLRPPGA